MSFQRIDGSLSILSGAVHLANRTYLWKPSESSEADDRTWARWLSTATPAKCVGENRFDVSAWFTSSKCLSHLQIYFLSNRYWGKCICSQAYWHRAVYLSYLRN